MKKGAQDYEVTPGRESLQQWSHSIGSHFIVVDDLVPWSVAWNQITLKIVVYCINGLALGRWPPYFAHASPNLPTELHTRPQAFGHASAGDSLKYFWGVLILENLLGNIGGCKAQGGPEHP